MFERDRKSILALSTQRTRRRAYDEVRRAIAGITHHKLCVLIDALEMKCWLSCCAMTKDGRYAGASCYEGGKFAVCDEKGARLEDSAFLYRRDQRPRPA